MLKTVNSYFSLVKFSHTIFALPFALIGFSLGVMQETFSFTWLTFTLMIGCMVFARTAAMAFNRFIDRKFDAQNPRTAVREIPAGAIKASSALALTIISALAFIVCTYFINSICFVLSPVALLVVLGYSYTKRFTPLCHLILGAGLALAPIGAYIAVTERFDTLPVLFSFLVFFWVSGFDIIYALQDDVFDRANKLRSIPVLLGRERALLVSRLLHFSAAVMVSIIFVNGPFSWTYLIGAVIFIGLLIYQHSLVKPNDLSKVTLAFGTTNGFASVIYCVFVCSDIFFKV